FVERRRRAHHDLDRPESSCGYRQLWCMPKCSNPYDGSVASTLHLRKSRNSCCHCCIRLVPVNTRRGTLTAASRRRSVGRSVWRENYILLPEPAFPRCRMGFLSDRESQAKRRRRIFLQRVETASPNRSNG